MNTTGWRLFPFMEKREESLHILLLIAMFLGSLCVSAQSDLDTLYHFDRNFNLVIFKSSTDSVDIFKQQEILLDRKNRTFYLPHFLGTNYTYKLQYNKDRNITTWKQNDCFEMTPLNYSLAINGTQTYYYFWDFDADNGDGSYIQWQYNDTLRAVQSYWYKAQGNDIYSYIHTYTGDKGEPHINIRLFCFIYFNNGTSAWHCMDIYGDGKLD